jgi:hypothetical protein
MVNPINAIMQLVLIRNSFHKARDDVIRNHQNIDTNKVHTYDFLNKRVRYAIESATARYPIIVIKLAMVEAMKG